MHMKIHRVPKSAVKSIELIILSNSKRKFKSIITEIKEVNESGLGITPGSMPHNWKLSLRSFST